MSQPTRGQSGDCNHIYDSQTTGVSVMQQSRDQMLQTQGLSSSKEDKLELARQKQLAYGRRHSKQRGQHKQDYGGRKSRKPGDPRACGWRELLLSRALLQW